MCDTHIRLIHHGVMERGVNFAVTKKSLHLFNWHTLVNGHCCQCAPEFMGMYPTNFSLFAELS